MFPRFALTLIDWLGGDYHILVTAKDSPMRCVEV